MSIICKSAVVLIALATFFASTRLSAQAYPPGTFTIDNIPVSCGPIVTILAPQLQDVGMNDLRGHIYVNPLVLASQPTVLKLFWYAHECGHTMVGPNETAADCWAIKLGKGQGWFPPEAFDSLEAIFANNPGDWTHLPGPARVAAIEKCYGYQKKKQSAVSDAQPARKSKTSNDDSTCSEEFDACMEDVTDIEACIRRKQSGCMNDCTTNYNYGYAACKNRFCNPSEGTNGRWEDACTERADRDKARCKDKRRECRDEHRKKSDND